ncbi:MAG TPA: hypothetical protein VFA66_13960 [Gaiellaceae bacterium]|nr:hypothetical protein [Gaiellaceae bacterium]
MRLALAVLVTVLALPLSAAAAPPLKVTFTARTHTPKVNAKWFYVVRATAGGKPVKARITCQLVDPVGGVHAVLFGSTTKPILNRPFTGSFRDFIRFPPESQGFKLTIRVTVKALGAKRVVSYWVRSR